MAVLRLKACFNTTIVSVELKVDKNSGILDFMFQYNHCFGGTVFISLSSSHFIEVSIQPLFRWNKLQIILFLYIKSFNTTIVSVELKQLALKEVIENMFQYNHCFGGT